MTNPRSLSTRKCQACAHPRRSELEMMAVGGSKPSVVGRRYGISRHVIHRHLKRHVTAERKARLALGAGNLHELTTRLVDESASVIDNLRSVRAALGQQLEFALAARDTFGVSTLAGRVHDNLRLCARITGELAGSPLVTINQQTTTNNVAVLLEQPALHKFLEAMVDSLADLPNFEVIRTTLGRVIAQHSTPTLALVEHSPHGTADTVPPAAAA